MQASKSRGAGKSTADVGAATVKAKPPAGPAPQTGLLWHQLATFPVTLSSPVLPIGGKKASSPATGAPDDDPRRGLPILRSISRESGHQEDPRVAREVIETDPGEPLPANVRSKFERSLGVDLFGLRLHLGAAGDRAARAVQARAFALGDHLAFRSGQFAPGTARGNELLAHELTHVRQHRLGLISGGDFDQHGLSHPGSRLESQAEQAALGFPLAHAAGPRAAGAAARGAAGAGILRQGLDEPTTIDLGHDITLEQRPAEGRAILRLHNNVWAQYLWDPQPGRLLPDVKVLEMGDPMNEIRVEITAPFRVDVMIDAGTEQIFAAPGLASFRVRHKYQFEGGVTTKLQDGTIERTEAPVELGFEYYPFIGEAPLAPARKALSPLAPPPTPLAPAKPVHQTWSFKEAAKYDAFAASHKDTKWAEILTKSGDHVAYALTVEAITRMAERLRKPDYNFEFLDEYPGGKVVSVTIHGEKLPTVETLATLYYRDVDSALAGCFSSQPECEIYGMEYKHFGRKDLSHQEALTRWGEIGKLTPDALAKLETSPGHPFQALRVRGASGMQTIKAGDLPTAVQNFSQSGEFTSANKLADDLSLLLPPDLDMAGAISQLKTLYQRKKNAVEGRESAESLDAIQGRIDLLDNKLREFGVRKSDSEIFDAIQKGAALDKVSAKLVVTPEGDHRMGDRTTLRVVFDYLPPGAGVEVSWRWKSKGNEYQFLKAPGVSKSLTLDLDEAFWNFAVGNDIGKNKGFEGLAYVSVDGGKTASLSLSTGWITLSDDVPATLTVGGPKVIVQHAWAEYQIAEWVPVYSNYSVDWYVDGKQVVEGLPKLRKQFDDLGTFNLDAKIYRVERSFGIRSKKLVADALGTVEVQDAEVAGNKLLDQAKPAASLPAVGASIESSIGELEKRVAQGGSAESYWKMQLEAQKKRQESLNRLAPDYKNTKDLPSDPTTLPGGDAFSGPIPAALVLPEGGAQGLSIYLLVHQEGGVYKARLLDITGADVWKFDGEGANPLEAYAAAFGTWKSNHPYPRGGKVVYRFAPKGWTLGSSFETNNTGNYVKAWVDGLLTVGTIVVIGLLLAAPDATVTKALAMVMLAATVARATVAIKDNIELGMSPLDSRNILEAASIITAFMGVSGGALRVVGLRAARPVVYRVGSWLVLATITADAATLVYTTDVGIEQMRAVQGDPTKDDSQKAMELLRIASTLMMQGAMFIVANKDMISGKSGLRRSDFFATDPKATAAGTGARTITLEPGQRLDVAAELRKSGDDAARLTKIPDTELLTRYSLMPWLSASLGEAEVGALLKRASTPALTGLSEITAKEAKALFDRIGNDTVANDLAPLMRAKPLDALLTATDKAKLADLHATFGPEGTAKFAEELGPDRIGKLMQGKEGVNASELKDLSEKLGNDVLKNLSASFTGGTDLTGKEIIALVKAHGEDAVKWAGKDLPGSKVKNLLTALTKDSVTAMQDIPASKASLLVNDLGAKMVNDVAPATGGARLATLRDQLGAAAASEMMAEKIKKGKVADLKAFADNLEAAKKAELASPTPVGPNSLILDSNAMVAIKKMLAGAKWDPAAGEMENNERAIINNLRVRAGLPPLTGDPPARDLTSIVGTQDIRASNAALAEEGTRDPRLTRSGVTLSVSRDDPAYTGLLKELAKDPKIGGNKGAVDRAVIADAALTKSSDGSPATFMTADDDVYARLARKFKPSLIHKQVVGGKMEGDAAALVREYGATGFTVSIPDGTGATHDLKVIPVK
jgi:hypothetical protein